MRSKWLIFVFVLSLAINAAVLATMGYHYYLSASTEAHAPCPLSPGDRHLYQSLGLSEAQLSEMEPLAQKFHTRLAELGAAMEGKRERLVELLAKDGDPASIENLRKEMAGIQGEIQREVISHIVQTKKILDPDQQKRFFDLMKQSMAIGKSPWFSPARRQAGTSGGK
jgi:Spy/CpxP family protein refolding chaperone